MPSIQIALCNTPYIYLGIICTDKKNANKKSCFFCFFNKCKFFV